MNEFRLQIFEVYASATVHIALFSVNIVIQVLVELCRNCLQNNNHEFYL